MKSIGISFLILLLSLTILNFSSSQPRQQNLITQQVNGCYICGNGTFVTYKEPDTMEKRNLAKTLFLCDVIGTTPVCKTDNTIIDK